MIIYTGRPVNSGEVRSLEPSEQQTNFRTYSADPYADAEDVDGDVDDAFLGYDDNDDGGMEEYAKSAVDITHATWIVTGVLVFTVIFFVALFVWWMRR